MRIEDIKMMEKYFPEWVVECENINDIAILSPSNEETMLLKKLFPDATIHLISEKGWNLYERYDKGKFDLIVISSTMMYSFNPALWMNNMINVTRYIWMCDCASGLRGNNGNYLGEDNDAARYKFTGYFDSDYKKAYDLVVYDNYIRSFVHYKLGVGAHFLMFFDFDKK